MGLYRTRRERLLWLAAAAYTGFLYATAYVVQFLLDALIRLDVAGIVVTGSFVAVAAVVGGWLVRQRPGPAEMALMLTVGVVYAVALLRLEVPQERLHFLQYGLLAGIIDAALLERRRAIAEARVRGPRWGRLSPLLAIALTALLGWGDEGIQHLLPNRYYDLRDVALNAAAGALLVGAVAARRSLRAGRGGRGGGGRVTATTRS